ncbi:aminodeoxychorismate/anthranilate synthase component II [Myxococcota bacterium]|jgi:anthranilate synthase/aminodeoxychorismate synthase-like glutamine amidotransferase|nr:aminodeoxychorismate/anthranilate synthase component II [Myxococcota bacterium]
MRAPRVLLVDNYDSFTFNVVQGLGALGADVVVRRNDALAPEDVAALSPTHVCISPGPGHPEAAGNSLAILRACLGRLPVLGICLGHQALAVALGGRVVAAKRLMHGRASTITHDGTGLFEGLEGAFEAGRYHSLSVSPDGLPPALRVNAHTDDDDREIMGLQHVAWPVAGVQFHPESVLTPGGQALFARFLSWRREA